MLGANTAIVLSSYIRALGYEARAHTVTSSDVDLNKLAVAAGLARVVKRGGRAVLENPYVGSRFGLAAVTTTLELAPDLPLAANSWLGCALEEPRARRGGWARARPRMPSTASPTATAPSTWAPTRSRS